MTGYYNMLDSYAEALGKSVEELTSSEKRQAFLEVLEETVKSAKGVSNQRDDDESVKGK